MRTFLTLCLAVVLVTWADAQQAAAHLTAAERLQQLKSNRAILEKMVSHSVALSHANDPIGRTAACRAAMGDLSTALDGAIAAQDANRVAELGEHLSLIVSDGLIPTIADARIQVPAGSEEEARLKDLYKQATDEMTRLELSVPRTNSLGRSHQVKETLAKWNATRDRLKKLFAN